MINDQLHKWRSAVPVQYHIKMQLVALPLSKSIPFSNLWPWKSAFAVMMNCTGMQQLHLAPFALFL